MHLGLCVCSLVPDPPIETRTRLVLVIHRYEDRKTTNTGRLAAACLSNSEVVLRGGIDAPSAPLRIEAGSLPLVLFPHVDAEPLELHAKSDRPITLIVPDGTWRQASKVRQRVPGLREMTCVSLPRGAPSGYRLRAEAHETGVSTIEAIARAMTLVEGAHVGAALDRVFRAIVDRTLYARGNLAGNLPKKTA